MNTDRHFKVFLKFLNCFGRIVSKLIGLSVFIHKVPDESLLWGPQETPTWARSPEAHWGLHDQDPKAGLPGTPLTCFLRVDLLNADQCNLEIPQSGTCATDH